MTVNAAKLPQVLNDNQNDSYLDISSEYTEISQQVSFESALFGLLIIIKDDTNGVKIDNKCLSIPAKNISVLQKISLCIEILCNTSVSFIYNRYSDSYSFNFEYLSKEIGMLLN